MDNRPITNKGSRQYRQQYINDNSTTEINEPTHIESFLSDSILSSDSRSILTTRTTLLTSESHRPLPDVETPTVRTNSSRSVDPTLDSSILVRTYLRQEKRNNRF